MKLLIYIKFGFCYCYIFYLFVKNDCIVENVTINIETIILINPLLEGELLEGEFLGIFLFLDASPILKTLFSLHCGQCKEIFFPFGYHVYLQERHLFLGRLVSAITIAFDKLVNKSLYPHSSAFLKERYKTRI